VLTCAPGDPDVSPRLWRGWPDRHAELPRISASSRHVMSASTAHYLAQDDPDLVVSVIADVVRAAAPVRGWAPGIVHNRAVQKLTESPAGS
jgi:hypothetical protein